MSRLNSKMMALNVGMALAVSVAAGCNSSDNSAISGARSDGLAGTVALALKGGQGVTLTSFAYAITGPKAYSGTLDVSNSSAVSATLGGIAVGTGYSLALTGTSTDGQTTCTGAAGPFDVAARATTVVSVAVDCHAAPRTGSKKPVTKP